MKPEKISDDAAAHLWWNAWTRMWWKVGQHSRVSLEAQSVVYCRQCGQEYDSYSERTVQGNDICAWSVQRDGCWMVHCGYGSDFDLREFWYIKDFPTEPVDGICDWCIRRMLRDGILVDSGKTCTIEYDGYLEE